MLFFMFCPAQIKLPGDRYPDGFASVLHFACLVGLVAPRQPFLPCSAVGGCWWRARGEWRDCGATGADTKAASSPKWER